MGCCCGAITPKDPDARSMKRDLEDLESQMKTEDPTGAASTKDDASSALSIKEDEGSNIVTDRLGHLVGPDSARSSFQVARAQIEPQYTATSQTSFRTPFACLQLAATDRMILIDFTPKALATARSAMQQQWSRGIQAEETVTERAVSFKLKGHPWLSTPDANAVESRRLLKGVIEALYDSGWVLNLSSSVCSVGRHEKDALIFRNQLTPPARCDWMAVAFLQAGAAHKLQLVDAPPDVVQIMAETLEAMCISHTEVTGSRLHEYELKDNPFQPGKKGTVPQELVLAVLPGLERCGFTVQAAIDQADGGIKPDTWYCCRTVGWSPGLPVFHR